MVSRPQPPSWASDDTRGPVGLECVFHSRYHGFITDRDGVTLELEADHRRPAEIENAIRDLKYGVGLNHLPSGKFAANGAWLAVQVTAHCDDGLGEGIVTRRRSADGCSVSPAGSPARLGGGVSPGAPSGSVTADMPFSL
jgi:hypothetical protein